MSDASAKPEKGSWRFSFTGTMVLPPGEDSFDLAKAVRAKLNATVAEIKKDHPNVEMTTNFVPYREGPKGPRAPRGSRQAAAATAANGSAPAQPAPQPQDPAAGAPNAQSVPQPGQPAAAPARQAAR